MEKCNTYNLIAFGNVLKYVREKSEMTQKEISTKASICHHTYFNIENGILLPNIETIIALSNAYNIDLLKLMIFDFKNEKKSILFAHEKNICSFNRDTPPINIRAKEAILKRLICQKSSYSRKKIYTRLHQLVLLCKCHKCIYTDDYYQLIMLCRKGLELTINNFSLQKINKSNHTVTELKFILYLITAHFKTSYQNGTIKHLDELINEITSSKSHQNATCILYHQIICELSRDFFLNGQLEKAIQLCSLGMMLEKHYFHKKSAYHHHYLMRYAEELLKLNNYELSLSLLYKEMIEFIDY